MNNKLPINFLGQYFNLEIYEQANINVSENVIAKNFCTFEVNDFATLNIGKNVFFNSSCVLRCREKIEIGDYCLFGDGVKIYDNNHHYSNYHVENLSFSTAPIKIGKHCWIGANSIILKGVTIGDNVIIGAGCTIYKDIPANSIVTSSSIITVKDRVHHKHQVTTFTASDTLEHLEYLVTSLPDVAFNIVASTLVSPYLNSFRRFKNVNLYSNINDFYVEEEILNRTNVYLDINHWWEEKNILVRVKEKNIPILSFDNTCHNSDLATKIIPSNNKEDMIEELNKYFD